MVECLPSGRKGLSSLGSTEKRRQNPKPLHFSIGGGAAVKLHKSNDYGFVPICSSGVNEVGGSGPAEDVPRQAECWLGGKAKNSVVRAESLPSSSIKDTVLCFHGKATNYQEKREWGQEVYETQLWCQKQRA